MEKISTSRAALLPRAANLATLAVVVVATWWSGAQRPAGQAATMAIAQGASAAEASDLSPQQRPAVLTAATSNATAAVIGTSSGTATTWPAQATTALARDGLQAVGYQTRAHR